MNRVVVLGAGGSGKSTFARALSAKTGIPSVELDSLFWSQDLQPTPPSVWRHTQARLTGEPRWILDGDLGPYDVLEARLQHADAVVLLDLPTWRCAWRAVRRSRNRLDFWRWLLTWRRRYRPLLLDSIARHAPNAALLVVRHPREVRALLDEWGRG